MSVAEQYVVRNKMLHMLVHLFPNSFSSEVDFGGVDIRRLSLAMKHVGNGFSSEQKKDSNLNPELGDAFLPSACEGRTAFFRSLCVG